MIDASDTYIVRDVLTDDIIFITPEDALGGNNGYDVLYDNEVRINLSRQRRGFFFGCQLDIDIMEWQCLARRSQQ
jgi:hypothetical protein